jgi:hypothetical protein
MGEMPLRTTVVLSLSLLVLPACDAVDRSLGDEVAESAGSGGVEATCEGLADGVEPMPGLGSARLVEGTMVEGLPGTWLMFSSEPDLACDWTPSAGGDPPCPDGWTFGFLIEADTLELGTYELSAARYGDSFTDPGCDTMGGFPDEPPVGTLRIDDRGTGCVVGEVIDLEASALPDVPVENGGFVATICP